MGSSMRVSLLLGCSLLVFAEPAVAATTLKYVFNASLTQTNYVPYPSQQPTVTSYAASNYVFEFPLGGPYAQTGGAFQSYGNTASVSGSTLRIASGAGYPGYGGLSILVNFDHDLGGQLPTSAAGYTSASWFESNAHAGFAQVTEGRINAFSVDVPEPQTWAMFIIGFGLLGGAMRARTRARLRTAATA